MYVMYVMLGLLLLKPMCKIACRLDRCFAGRPTIKIGVGGTRALAHSIDR